MSDQSSPGKGSSGSSKKRPDPKKEEEEDDDDDDEATASAFAVSDLLEELRVAEEEDRSSKPVQVLTELSLAGIAEFIKKNKCKNIITMAGAGISTAAGIPDFRSPSSGIYNNLKKYNLPAPEAIFEISYFKQNPEPFFDLARDMWPGKFKPTICHYFLNLLNEKGVLLRHYTQNIDTLELIAGLPEDKVVEAHGSFAHAHCLECKTMYTKEWTKEKVFAGGIPTCTAPNCAGVVKPDIVFFGQSLPARFFALAKTDFLQCDLLIVMGTSLVVQPFASLVSAVKISCPRAYFNMQIPTPVDPFLRLLGMSHDFAFDRDDNYRDIFCQGSCDDTCMALADAIGWKKDLTTMVKSGHSKIDAEDASNSIEGQSTSASKTPENKAASKTGANKAVKQQPVKGASPTRSTAKGRSTSNSPVKTQNRKTDKAGL